MSARLLRSSVMLLVVSLLLAACGPSAKAPTADKEVAPSEQAAATEEGTPKRGGILRIASSGSSEHTSDPAMGQTPYSVWYYMGAPMIYQDIETWELKPGVIESWEYSPDGKEVTLKVRQGVKFFNKPPTNGREVEARDIVYTLRSISGKQYPELPSVRFPTKSDIEAMVDAEVVDKYTVKVTLSRPSSSFLAGTTMYRSNYVLPDGLREHWGGVESLFDPNNLPVRHIKIGRAHV